MFVFKREKGRKGGRKEGRKERRRRREKRKEKKEDHDVGWIGRSGRYGRVR